MTKKVAPTRVTLKTATSKNTDPTMMLEKSERWENMKFYGKVTLSQLSKHSPHTTVNYAWKKN